METKTTKPKAERQKVFTVKDFLASKNGASRDALPENKKKKPATKKVEE